MKSMKLSRGCLFKKLMKRQKLALLQEARPPSKAIEHAPRLLCAGELLTLSIADQKIFRKKAQIGLLFLGIITNR